MNYPAIAIQIRKDGLYLYFNKDKTLRINQEMQAHLVAAIKVIHDVDRIKFDRYYLIPFDGTIRIGCQCQHIMNPGEKLVKLAWRDYSNRKEWERIVGPFLKREIAVMRFSEEAQTNSKNEGSRILENKTL